MATDFGTDISCVTGLDPSLALVTGNTVLAQAIARRLITPRGGLFYDSDYGYNVRGLLGASLTQAELGAVQSMVETECEKDGRVKDARVDMTVTGETVALSIVLSGNFAPFRLVLAVSNLTADILRIEAA